MRLWQRHSSWSKYPGQYWDMMVEKNCNLEILPSSKNILAEYGNAISSSKQLAENKMAKCVCMEKPEGKMKKIVQVLYKYKT